MQERRGRCKPGIAAANRVVSFVFQVVAEARVHPGRRARGAPRICPDGLAQTATAIERCRGGSNPLRAGIPLLNQTFQEELLEESRKLGVWSGRFHRTPLSAKRSKRRAPTAISSGAAVTYQYQ